MAASAASVKVLATESHDSDDWWPWALGNNMEGGEENGPRARSQNHVEAPKKRSVLPLNFNSKGDGRPSRRDKSRRLLLD